MKATRAGVSQFDRVKRWMHDPQRQITFLAVAEKLGISESTVRKHLNSSTIPTEHHKKLLALGFPAELLPLPEDKKPGRKRMTPKFPGNLHTAPEAKPQALPSAPAPLGQSGPCGVSHE